MIIKSIRISVFVFSVSIAANAQNFQARIADLDEKAAELQRRLHENELRLQRHSEVMEQAQARLKALQSGEQLPAPLKIPAAPPEPVRSTGKTPAPPPIAPKQRARKTRKEDKGVGRIFMVSFLRLKFPADHGVHPAVATAGAVQDGSRVHDLLERLCEIHAGGTAEGQFEL